MQDIKNEILNLRRERDTLTERIVACERVLVEAHQDTINRKLANKTEPFGSVTIDDIKFTIPKYVKWDQARLEEIAHKLNDPYQYITVHLSVTEDKYKNLTDDLAQLFDTARTLKQGKINVSFRE